MKQREAMVVMDRKGPLSIRAQCRLLGVHRSNLYYKAIGLGSYNVELMRLMGAHAIAHPAEGVRSMVYMLSDAGHRVNSKRVKRLLGLMGHKTIYPKRNLSKLGSAKYKRPYLLKGLRIKAANEVWCTDITYLPMARGMMYLMALIDVYSRKIVGWELWNTLFTTDCIELVEKAISTHGTPSILNTDQGPQYTAKLWLDYLKKKGIRASMDAKGRAIDNIWIERFWRTIKYECTMLYPAEDGQELYRNIKGYIAYYNYKRTHHSLKMTPYEKYLRSIKKLEGTTTKRFFQMGIKVKKCGICDEDIVIKK